MQKTEDREVVHLYTVYKYCTSNGCGDAAHRAAFKSFIYKEVLV